MADARDKVEGSVPGRYYVDTQCIDCDVCRVTAPGNFERDEAKGFSFVSRQPETPEEETRCAEAMDCCPVEAIGSDGEALVEMESPQPASVRK
jgi:ferredoxin